MVKHYFLGRATGDGFSTHIHDLIANDGYFTYIIKGGPGTGKSSLMKQVAENMTDGEVFHCSSDPDSLDGVLISDRKILIVDGTAPHVVEPLFPGVRQKIVNLGECWEEKLLKDNAREVVEATLTNKAHHARVRRCIRAMEALYQDGIHLQEECLIKDKAERFVRSEVARLPKRDKQGCLEFRQMSAITPKGLVELDSAIGLERAVIEDDFGGVRDAILKSIAREAVAKGYHCIISENPMCGDTVYNCLVITEAGVAYLSSGECSRKVRADRFLEKNMLKARKGRLAFDLGTAKELISESVNGLMLAKESHDLLESYYIRAMDFDKVTEVRQKILSEIA